MNLALQLAQIHIQKRTGQGCVQSWVRRPASTCATGTPALTAASVAPSALEVSP